MLRAATLVLQGEAEGPVLVQPRDEKLWGDQSCQSENVITKMEPGFSQRCLVG